MKITELPRLAKAVQFRLHIILIFGVSSTVPSIDCLPIDLLEGSFVLKSQSSQILFSTFQQNKQTLLSIFHLIQTTTMINRLFVLSLVLVTPIQRIYALCNLCAQGLEGLSWPHHYVDTNGKTCAQKSIDMAYINNENSPNCQSEIAAYRGRCCGPNEPGPIQQTPTKPPTYNGPMGPYSKCELCRDGDFPSTYKNLFRLFLFHAQFLTSKILSSPLPRLNFDGNQYALYRRWFLCSVLRLRTRRKHPEPLVRCSPILCVS